MGSSDQPNQLPLFDVGLDLSRLRIAQGVIMEAARARNTLKAYRHSWKLFVRWCEDAGRCSLPATSDTVALYVVWSVEQRRYRLETIRTNMSAIRAMHIDLGHPSPVDSSVRSLIVNAARRIKESPAGKIALPPEYLRRICELLLESPTLLDVRDRAMLLIGFALGWRRSELVSLRVSDVAFVRKGIRIRLGASKTDQDGSIGRQVGIPFGADALTCPVKALRAWIRVRGIQDGPLFTRISFRVPQTAIPHKGLRGDVINRRLKRAIRRIGRDARMYGAHSLRSGMVTASTENGADLPAIMQRTGHRSIETVMRYVRPARAFRSDPLKGVL